ncbi:hypothetical protein [Anaerobutyricum hallii]|uniref:hypothetical protein n=1 Tax=Anaerobutyricum hallii TaxID=39488 RepID=UPI0039A14ED4
MERIEQCEREDKEIATKEQKDAMKEMFRMVDKSKVDEVKRMLEYAQKGTANNGWKLYGCAEK